MEARTCEGAHRGRAGLSTAQDALALLWLAPAIVLMQQGGGPREPTLSDARTLQASRYDVSSQVSSLAFFP